jgi:hypothetical protein
LPNLTSLVLYPPSRSVVSTAITAPAASLMLTVTSGKKTFLGLFSPATETSAYTYPVINPSTDAKCLDGDVQLFKKITDETTTAISSRVTE